MAHDEIQHLKENLTRREWIELFGTTTIVGSIAGCTGNGEETPTSGGDGGDEDTDGGMTETTTTGGDGGMDFPPSVDRPLVARFATEPQKAQWNQYNTRSQASYGFPLMFQSLAKLATSSGEFVPWLARDWEWITDGEHLRLHLGDFWTWHDGTQFTADDVATKLKLSKYLGGTSDVIGEVEVIDDYTVDVRTPEQLANFIPELTLFTESAPEYIDTPHHIFGDMVEEIENTDPDTDARDEALGAVANYQFKPPVGLGAWKQSEAQAGRVVLEPYEDFPVGKLQQQIEESDKIDYEFPDWAQTEPNFPEIHLKFFSDPSSLRQAWFTSNIDIGSVSPPEGPEIVEQFPETLTMTLNPTFRGSCIAFKLDHPIYQHREIRRAMAYAMDVPSIAKTTYGATGFPNTSMSGLPKALVNIHLSDDFVNNTLESYAAQDYDAANAEMQSLADRNGDFAKSGGNWTFQGDPIRIELSAPAIVSSHMNAMRQLQSWLQDIGFNAEVRGVEGAQFWSQTMPNGDYTVTQNYFGGAQPHPYYAYRNTWINGFLINESHNPPAEVTVPPMGESSGSMTVKVQELTQELGTSITDERQLEILETLAWAWNQTLPYVPYAERHNAWAQIHERFHFAHPDDKMQSIQRNPYVQPNLGLAIARSNPVSTFPYDPKYLSIDGTDNPDGLTLDESKSQIAKRDESW